MTLKEAQEQFEAKFKNIMRDKWGDTPAYAPNGKKFVAVMSGGVKAEGVDIPDSYKHANENLAAAAWLSAANELAASNLGTLYWRQEPIYQDGMAYSRFVTE